MTDPQPSLTPASVPSAEVKPLRHSTTATTVGEPAAESVGSACVLRTEALRRSYGRVCAVDDLNLSVREGEIYGFLGRNGAGKTTTIRMLMGIIKPDRGYIHLLGWRGRRPGIAQKRRIGYVSQEQTFYPWMNGRSLGRFVSGFYPRWDHAEFERLLKALDVPPERRASELSGGMRVKLALALALAHRPELLILDEPTAGLDPVARREFLDIVEHQARNHQRTTFFSSHLIDEVERIADRIGILDQGRLRYEGEVALLVSSVRELRIDLSVSGPEPFPLPDGAEVLRSERRENHCVVVARAAPEAWEALAAPGLEINRLSLEDIFIALVASSGAEV